MISKTEALLAVCNLAALPPSQRGVSFFSAATVVCAMEPLFLPPFVTKISDL